MAGSNIDQIFGLIEKEFVGIAKNAARSAANKAQKDIRSKADRFIKEYYAYTPKAYSRTYALYRLVEDYYAESDSGKGISIEFGIKYNPSNIAGAHHSNSWYHQSGGGWVSRLGKEFNSNSQDNGIPGALWITEKFIDGIHPSGKLGDNGGIADGLSPDEKMQQFFDGELEGLVYGYIQQSLMAAVAAYF